MIKPFEFYFDFASPYTFLAHKEIARIEKENLIQLDRGDGLTIAYHGLNLGRISLCANASGCMKMMLECLTG